MKLTEEIWDDFLNNAVDASGAAGWKWFKEKYGFTYESFKQQILSNQEKAEKWDKIKSALDSDEGYSYEILKLMEENKQLKDYINDLQTDLPTHNVEEELKELLATKEDQA